MFLGKVVVIGGEILVYDVAVVIIIYTTGLVFYKDEGPLFTVERAVSNMNDRMFIVFVSVKDKIPKCP